MKKMKTTILIWYCFLPFALADLSVGYYTNSCPLAEDTVRGIVHKYFAQDPSVPAALLRMHFHDCFVRGCDASLLIDPTNQTSSEKNSLPNRTVRWYKIIDEAKEHLEQLCPMTVSCADIIALATRDGVGLAGGPIYYVPTGRKDGFVSNEKDVNLPGPNLNVSEALQFFTARNLTLQEMVTLTGAHTVGFAHCSFFRNRISTFSGFNDPTMDPALNAYLARMCGSSQQPEMGDPTTAFGNTPTVFDNKYYGQLIQRRGVLRIDQQLAEDPLSSDIVSRLSTDDVTFQDSFADAMIKLGTVGVLLGNDGNIRRNCRVFN